MTRKGYSIGDVSTATGVNIETVRYYERIELLPKPDRTSGGNRQYNYDQLKRLAFIKRCRELGFSIEEIRSLLAMTDSKTQTCAEVNKLTTTHLSKVKDKILDLQRMGNLLETMVAQCSCGDVPECPIVDTLLEI
ncbi:MerR family transcriptional regulator [Maritalea sp.]|jgi:MerR family mercuric resistance operon transcriptional regulator|uniref:MerR family transcriptional regulator n=1 Tax=Maritalea sp. TaxID=2003361 RepID=UPI0039E6374A